MIRGKMPPCKGEEREFVKKSEVDTQCFIVTIPREIDEVVFLVSANAKPPYAAEKNIFWIRARELGTETWGQTIWAEVHDQEDGLFVSKEIKPSALWLSPNTTYEIEVAPETLDVRDYDLTVQVKEKPKPPEGKGGGEGGMKKEKGSAFDSPVFWAVMAGIVLVKILIWISCRGVR